MIDLLWRIVACVGLVALILVLVMACVALIGGIIKLIQIFKEGA